MSENSKTKTKTNVVGIGHNDANAYSKEQYEKLLNRFHYVLDYALTCTYGLSRKFNEAITGYKNSASWQGKLKTFEIHEKRQEAQDTVRVLLKSLNSETTTVEAKAKTNGLKLEVVEKNKAAEAECDRENAKEAEEDAAN